MSDIRNQLIKDSYNYVLQSDLLTGVVYRIGGDIPVNPIFQSGLTVTGGFTYSGAGEQVGYVLTCDEFGNANWAPASAATPSSGVTSVTAGNGLSGNVTTGAITLINTAPDQTVTISGGTGITTGGTYPNFTIVNSAPDRTVTLSGGTNIGVLGTYPDFSISFTGSIPTQGITGITGTSGVSASTTDYVTTIINTSPDQTVTISGGTGITTGGTYPNFTIVNSAPDRTVTLTGGTNIQITGTYPDFGVNYTGTTIVQGITGITGTSGVSASTTDYGTTIVNTAPDRTVTLTGGTNIQITGTYPDFGINFTGTTGVSGDYLPLSGGTLTGGLVANSGITANTISATTYFNLPISGLTEGNNISITGANGNFRISFTGTTGSNFTGGTVSGPTNFTNGLTANTISATTYYNLPTDVFVTGGTYTSGNAIFTNNTGGTFIVTGFAIGGGGSQPFYLNLSQAKNGNRYLSTTASTAAEQSTGVTIANGVTSTIASFQSDQLNITLIPDGIWSFYLHSYKQNNNASFNIFVEVYKRTSGGTETLLFTTDPSPVTTNSPNPSMQLSDAYFNGSSILVSDSIVARVRATNTGNQSHIITLVSEGSQHYSYVVSTIPTQQGLTCDTLSGCSIIQTIQTDVSNKLDKSGGTITGNLIINSGLTANTISATTYYNLPVSAVTNGDGISASTSGGVVTITNTRPQGITGITANDGLSGDTTNFATIIINTDKGSSQNIFKNIQIGGVTQFGANSNNSDLNFSGVGITIASAATNTLAFTNAGVTSITAGSGLSGNSTTGAVNLQLSASSYSMFANNTAATSVPSFTTFKEVGEQAMVATITWNNTPPSGTTNVRYRWFQIGNMVYYFFFFNYSVAGTNNSIIIFDFPSDMPTPTPPTGTGSANTYIYRGTGLGQTSPTNPSTAIGSGIWGGGIRRDSGNTKYEFFFSVGTAIAARAFYHSGFYFA